MIAGEISSSESLSKCTFAARWCHVCIVTKCDNLGTIDGRPRWLLSNLYALDVSPEADSPIKPVTIEDVSTWVDELVKASVLHRFTDGDREYLHLPNWHKHQRLRYDSSKWPNPYTYCAGCKDEPQPAVNGGERQTPSAGVGGSPQESAGVGGSPQESAGVRRSQTPSAEVKRGEEKRREESKALSSAGEPSSGANWDWSKICDASGMYGRRWTAKVPNRHRKAIITARLKENDNDASLLVGSVHGYVALHFENGGQNDPKFDPWKNFAPETIFRPSLNGKYVEAWKRYVKKCGGEPILPVPIGGVSEGERDAANRALDMTE